MPESTGGRPVEPLTPGEADKVLGLLRKGRGRDAATHELRIGYRRFKRHFDTDGEFRAEVLHAQRVADQKLDAIGYDLAASGDKDALFKLWGRRDRTRQLAQARADAAAERESRRKETEKSGGPTMDSIVRLGIEDMTPAEQEGYLRIVDKQLAGRELDDEESRVHGRFAVRVLTKLLARAMPRQPAL